MRTLHLISPLWLVTFSASKPSKNHFNITDQSLSLFYSLSKIVRSIRIHDLNVYWDTNKPSQPSSGTHILLKMLTKWLAHSIASRSTWFLLYNSRVRTKTEYCCHTFHLDDMQNHLHALAKSIFHSAVFFLQRLKSIAVVISKVNVQMSFSFTSSEIYSYDTIMLLPRNRIGLIDDMYDLVDRYSFFCQIFTSGSFEA